VIKLKGEGKPLARTPKTSAACAAKKAPVAVIHEA
jgi:hypothetical protein